MTLAKGRILRGPATRGAKPIELAFGSSPSSVPLGKVLRGSVAAAAREAADRLSRAEQAARTIVEDGERAARSLRDQARIEGRQEGAAELAAAWIKLRSEDNARAERDFERTVELARAMTERLVGASLALDPATIVAMCRQTLASAQRARHVVVRAHPADAEVLGANLSSLGLEQAAIEIHADETRARGSLLFETDLGILDADLTIQLDRLTRSLRDSLRP